MLCFEICGSSWLKRSDSESWSDSVAFCRTTALNNWESDLGSLGSDVVWRSWREGGASGKIGKLGSDIGGGDKLESLILAVELMILMNLLMIISQ